MEISNILKDKEKLELCQYSPLTLAFIGDAVYELYVRSRIVGACNTSAGKLHKLCVEFVKAKAQADAAKMMMDKLTEEELSVLKRGRNAKSTTVPKNADVTDYRLATGFEALIGYLYLDGREERLIELCELAVANLS